MVRAAAWKGDRAPGKSSCGAFSARSGEAHGAALGPHWGPIHYRALQVLLRTRDIKMTHRMVGHFSMVAGEGLALACGLRQDTALERHWRSIHYRALQVLFQSDR